MALPGFAVDPEILRLGMRQWATGVTVVTSLYAGEYNGMTVSSFTSISLQPPLVLVSLERGTRTHHMVERSRLMAITILDRTQQEISERFAGRVPGIEDRFSGVETYTLVTGALLLSGGLAGVDCLVVDSLAAGDHTIFIGHVLAAQLGQGTPLIYYDRGYHGLEA